MVLLSYASEIAQSERKNNIELTYNADAYSQRGVTLNEE
jgi:hypothetical protein